MAEFDVSCSSKIKAKIEVNMGSLEGEYKGNKLNFERAFTIDSGKGSNYNAQIKICDHRIENKSCAYLSRPHRKAIYFVIHGIQRADIVINLSFDGKTKTLLCTNSNIDNKVEYKGVTLSNILDNLITEKIDKPLKMDITIEFEPGNLRTAISKENLFDVIKAANFIDEELMSKAAEFIMKSDSFHIEDNPKWDEFCKENPECGNKILKLVVVMLKKK